MTEKYSKLSRLVLVATQLLRFVSVVFFFKMKIIVSPAQITFSDTALANSSVAALRLAKTINAH